MRIRTLIVIATLAGLSLQASASDEDAAAWLIKMSNALRAENYEGVFTFMRGSTFDTVRIVHKVEDDVERERLFFLNGDVRELYREGDDVLLVRPKIENEPEEEPQSVQLGPFSPFFAERVLATQNLYRLSLHGDDRIANRETIKLAILPRNNDRYGYRVWLDKETGLLLQSHLVERGRIKEIFQFTNIRIGEAIDQTAIASAIDGETYSNRLALDINDRPEKPGWKVGWLPDGFRPVKVRGNRLHFTDGLATFSVFVEKPDQEGLPELTTTVGGTVVITKRLKQTGPQITVVGEVPVSTAQRVADSIEPVIY